MLLSGCGGDGKKKINGYLRSDSYASADLETVFLLNDYEVPFDLYRYLYLSHCADLLTDNAALAKDPSALSDKAVKLTEESLRWYFAVIDLAKEYDIALDKETVTAVIELMQEGEAQYNSREEYLAAIEGNFLTEEVYYNLLLTQELEAQLFDYMIEESTGIIDSTDATVEKDIQENFYAAEQIFVAVNSDDERSEKLKLAQSLYAEAVQEDADFEAIAEKGDDRQGVRYFTSGATLSFFEDTVKSLKIGEISSIVESNMGFHIILRLPLDDGYINKHFEDLRYDYLTRCYNTLVENRGKRLKAEERESLAEKQSAMTASAVAGK